jgi:hypothetical protein
MAESGGSGQGKMAKRPWVKPTVRRLELNERIILLFRSQNPGAAELPDLKRGR